MDKHYIVRGCLPRRDPQTLHPIAQTFVCWLTSNISSRADATSSAASLLATVPQRHLATRDLAQPQPPLKLRRRFVFLNMREALADCASGRDLRKLMGRATAGRRCTESRLIVTNAKIMPKPFISPAMKWQTRAVFQQRSGPSHDTSHAAALNLLAGWSARAPFAANPTRDESLSLQRFPG